MNSITFVVGLDLLAAIVCIVFFSQTPHVFGWLIAAILFVETGLLKLDAHRMRERIESKVDESRS